MTFFPYDTVSAFFEDQGDFQENILPEHAFQAGDGETDYVDRCQFPGCGAWLSEHEEGEPCCYPFFATGGRDHAFDCNVEYRVV